MKGKGYAPAEVDPVGFHAINKLEKKPAAEAQVPVAPAAPVAKKPKYQDVFGQWLCDMAERDDKLMAITPAMCEGSGMVAYARRFPDRFFDVAIAEQHAVTLGAGMACEGLKPVVAIYSTFLQRAYDQLIHDVALQKLDVTFAIDRAGLVGQDGPTHHGAFDLSYLRCVPNMIIAAPSDENECRQLLYTAYRHPGPSAVRYPRGTGPGALIAEEMTELPIGRAVSLRQGQRLAILNFGALLDEAIAAGEALDATVIDMRWVKPLDEAMILELAASHECLFTLEENAVAGGAGAGVSEFLAARDINLPVRHFGIDDSFVEHGDQGALRAGQGLHRQTLIDTARELLLSPMKAQELLMAVERDEARVALPD
jgi:1-deoxy-D-xylulose-5-phosphate synthase